MIRWERRSSSTNTVPRPRSARAILYNKVVRRLERLLALSEKTAEDLRARGEAITGEICLALRGGGGNTAVLTRAMAAFRRCHPQVRFSLPDCDAAASVRLDPVLRYGQAAWAAALVRAGAGAALCPDGEDWGGGAALCAPECRGNFGVGELVIRGCAL